MGPDSYRTAGSKRGPSGRSLREMPQSRADRPFRGLAAPTFAALALVLVVVVGMFGALLLVANDSRSGADGALRSRDIAKSVNAA